VSTVPVALQLYTVRDQTAVDFPGTVRRVAELGYAGIELAGDGGLTAEQLRALLDETGLRLAGSHVPLERMIEDMDGVIAYYQDLGSPYVGVPFLGEAYRSAKGFREAARALNRAGAALQEAGMSLYYHNHAFEFEPLGETTGMEILLGRTGSRGLYHGERWTLSARAPEGYGGQGLGADFCRGRRGNSRL